jgi:Ni/Fe-hydrogenase subunit HybB-like protein
MMLERGHTETEQLVDTALQPTERWTPGVKLVALALLAVVLWGVYLYTRQLRHGLSVTGLDCPVFWGIYITNFVFFIGISHAGTLISAILRVTGAVWRKPLTRMAEAITVFALVVGPLNVIFDLGRPDRVPNMIKHPHFASPLVWDICCISTYFVASITYLFLPLMPDIAILRDRYPERWWYRWLALNWRNTEAQQRMLRRIISIMAIVVIPIAISVHTVVSWVFAMTLQPMWHSSIFGPYFVVGAIYSGIATLLIAIAILRRAYHLEEFVKPRHFEYLGYLLITFAVAWGYFTFAEFLTTYRGNAPEEMRVFNAKLSGEFAGVFWAMIYSMVAAFLTLTLSQIPVAERKAEAVLGRVLRPVLVGAAMLACVVMGRLYLHPALTAAVPSAPIHSPVWNPPAVAYHGAALLFLILLVWTLAPVLHTRPVPRIVLASVFINIGMWLERYVIVVPSLSHPRLPLRIAVYHPTMVEWSLTAADFALFALLFLLFSRVFPMLPIWEMLEKEEVPVPAAELEPGYAGSGAVGR